MLAGVAATGLLAACGAGAKTAESAPPDDLTAAKDVPEKQTSLAATADVPEGGGLVVPDKWVVVTQPTPGDFHAFSAICPHQGCTVGRVTAERIYCPCHGSQFSATTGDVLKGPATSGLEVVPIQVEGDRVLNSPRK